MTFAKRWRNFKAGETVPDLGKGMIETLMAHGYIDRAKVEPETKTIDAPPMNKMVEAAPKKKRGFRGAGIGV
jgi:hypothetical protein